MEIIIHEMQIGQGRNPPNLRNVERRKVKKKILVDEVLHYIPVNKLEEINNLLKAVTSVIAGEVGVKTTPGEKRKIPWWKRRIVGQIKQLRKEVSQLHHLKEGRLQNVTIKESLERKYKIRKRGLGMVTKELKQRITAKAETIKHYERRFDQYQQNRLFQNNQRRLFEKTGRGGEREQ